MRLIVRAAAVTAVAGIGLLGATGGAAHAATGTFSYLTADMGPIEMVDPPAGCHNLEGQILAAFNGMDAEATFYVEQNCAMPVGTLAPGAGTSIHEVTSVSFPS